MKLSNQQTSLDAGAKETDRITSFTEAVNVLDAAGILLVAAAGNEQQDNDAIERMGYPNSPANINDPNVVAVGAIDASGDAWSEGPANSVSRVPGTNYGKTTVDIGAPGAQIVGAQASIRGSAGVESRYGIHRLGFRVSPTCLYC